MTLETPEVIARPDQKRARAAAAALALVLLAAYWLTTSGAFHSIDEHAVFAVSRNLVYHGRIDQSSLFWAPPYDAHAKVGAGEELYSKYGAGHSLLVALPVALARLIPGAGLVTSSMLLDMLATALTGGLLVLIAVRLGYSVSAGVNLGLLYGLASFAWVYARTMFSEPLVALFWAMAVYLLLDERTVKRAFLAGLCLAASIAVRPAMTVLIPFFLGLLWLRPLNRFIGRLIAFGAPLALTAAGLLAFNAVRFGNPFDFGYTETFNGSLIGGILGFLFSLDRSIFLFAPPLVALFWSLPLFARRHRGLTWQLAAIPLAGLVLYSLWPVFWGGPVWGPRYLLPALPIAFVFLLPAVEQALARQGWRRIALYALTVLGVLMQLRGVVWNSLPLTQTLGQRYPLWLLPPQREMLDLVWAVHRPFGAVVALAMLVAVALAVRRSRLLPIAGAATVFGSLLLLSWIGDSPLGFTERPVYRSALAQLAEAGRPGDALVLNPAPYQSPIDQLTWFLNARDATMPFYGVLRLPPGEDAASTARLTNLLGKYDRLWLLTEGVTPGDPQSTAEAFLREAVAYGGDQWLEDGFRLARYDGLLPVQMEGEPDVRFGNEVVLERWAVGRNAARPDDVQVTLRWRANGPTETELHTFVQVLDEAGQPAAAWDGAPGAGLAPSTEWQAGQVIEERIGLALPPDVQGRPTRIIVGMYDTATAARLRLPDGSDSLTLSE